MSKISSQDQQTDGTQDKSQDKKPRPSDNFIQPFMLESSGLRGRSVRLGSVLDDILKAHDYPQEVSQLVAEKLVLTALLSSLLKFDGIFTLQTSGDGPVKTLVSDMVSNGDIRACASFDEQQLSEALKTAGQKSNKDQKDQAQCRPSEELCENLIGKGHMLFSVDQAGRKDRYQGIVALEGGSLASSVQHYFTQSEQVKTGIKIAISCKDGIWRGAGIMVQKMPDGDGRGDDLAVAPSNVDEDDWRRAMILMSSCTDAELTDVALPVNDLLLRLFHEEGVRVFEPKALKKNCRCSLERVQNVISAMPKQEQQEIAKDGVIEVTCEFCSTSYKVKPES